ncbi:MAG: hypothetical protein K2L93_01330 [Muribaculaceae bacterium]|nr:hypothetical protein [Muribaculaceae bacterium]
MATTLCGCHSHKNGATVKDYATDIPTAQEVPALEVSGGTYSALPRAVVYKMNGDYADCVPITVSADGETIVSYPAPTDLTPESTPLPVVDGYLLDRRGVNANTRFLRLTYDEYRALQQPPTLDQLKADIIPGARVIDIHRLPITLNQAINDLPKVNQLISEFK